MYARVCVSFVVYIYISTRRTLRMSQDGASRRQSWLFGGASQVTKQSSEVVRDVVQDRLGSIIVSVILGLGLAVIFFRRVCKGDSCIVVRGPGKDVNRGQFYRLEGDCYQYVPYAVDCENSGGNNNNNNNDDVSQIHEK